MASCAMRAMCRLHCASCCWADKNTAPLIAIARIEFEELLGAHHHTAAMIYRRFDALCRRLRASNVQLVRTPIKVRSDLTLTK
jgi:hypothetical protein